MKTITRLGAVAAAAGLFAGLGTTVASASPANRQASPVGTVFVQNDSTNGNRIVSYDRLAGGTLRRAGIYASGGKGLALDGSAVDHLASQSSLVRRGQSLFSVNAGSNTITSFAVVGDKLVRRTTVSSGGTAPVSIAAHGALVYVLNARDGGSIQGYLNVAGILSPIPGWNRPLGLDPNATPEFTHTPAQIAFTPDGSKLIVSTKGDTSAFDVFKVGLLGPATKPVVTTFDGDVPFGFQFDAAGNLIAAEAGPNAVASFTVNSDGTLTKNAERPTGQQATCWLVVDGDYAYASNAGSGTLSGYRIGKHASLTLIGATATDDGTVDAAATPDGRSLYVQTGAAGIVDEYRVVRGGSLAKVGSVTVPGGIGAEGIVAR